MPNKTRQVNLTPILNVPKPDYMAIHSKTATSVLPM
jgi:hypothetical protein